MRLAFADTSATVEIPDSTELLAALHAAAPGWPFTATGGDRDPVATVRASGGSFELEIAGEDPVQVSAVSAACSTMVDVVGAYNRENPGRLCFHCGAAEFAGQLVVFPSRARAGKSTLIARLAAAGYTVFSDDILPVSDDDMSGIALGIAPRLRLPLPETASQPFRRFVSRRSAAGDGRYLYLGLPKGRLAPRNSTAPLGAIVLLERRESGPASLGQASRSTILRSLIVQNFGRAAPARELLERLHTIMDRLPRLVLRYSDLEEATALLEETFSSWPPRLDALAASDADDGRGYEAADGAWTRDPRSGPESLPDTPFLQNPNVSLQAVDGELFLAHEDGTSIHQLNTMGAGLWNLLAEPATQHEMVEILCGAFPDADSSAIIEDVAQLLADLAYAHFIIPYE